MDKKYEFIDETIDYDSYRLHRIRRLSDGKIGGWIETEINLSQEGNCWVDGDAKVFDGAIISDNAKVYDNAVVCGDALVYGDASIYGDAKIYDDGWVRGNAQVYGCAQVYGKADIYDNAKVYENAKVYDDAQIYGDAKVYGDAKIYGNAQVYGNGWARGNAEVCGNAQVCGNINIGEYTTENYHEDEKSSSKEVVQDFIYKVDDSNKLTTQTEYDSINEFFDTPITNDIKLDTLVICTVDAKEPLIKLQKINSDGNKTYKFIVEITSNEGDDFIVRSIIKSQEQLNELIQQTVEALRLYPKFSKYADTLEECL